MTTDTRRFEGYGVLITGAARGIGHAVVRRFAAEGAVLWLNDLDATELDAVADELRATGSSVAALAGDMSDRTVVDRWVADAIDELIRWARSGDAVVVTGKGHEVGQIVGSQVLHFDDREEVRRALAERAAKENQ